MTQDTSTFGYYAPDSFVQRILTLTRRQPVNWLGRRLAFILRRLALRHLRGRPVDTTVWNGRMRLRPYGNVCEKRILFTPQFFDLEEREKLAEHIETARQQQRKFHFIDIGANIGGYALFVSSKAQGNGCILAVEPQPDVFDSLCYNIAANPQSGIKAIAAAISDTDGDVTLFLDSRNKGETSMRLVGFEPGTGQSLTVPAMTLHHLLDQEGWTTFDALKLDVEGAEDLILVPFFRTAPASLWPRLMIIEDGRKHWQSDLMALLHQCGYSLTLQTRLNLVFERTAPTPAD